jgi:hypothetical protein
MRAVLFLFCMAGSCQSLSAQRIDSFILYGDVRITIDQPFKRSGGETILILYALPNGNTTEQTMGKRIQEGDDWHFDIQHIRAQTAFLRKQLKQNITVAYLENSFKSWPLWKQNHSDYTARIQRIVDTLKGMLPQKKAILYLNGHSGGGSFIFGYLQGIKIIPTYVQRISFLDSNYGYDSSYTGKLRNWLQQNKKATLTVFAYNDSVALYNSKPVVSATGGTWYKSKQMMRDLPGFSFRQLRNDSLIIYESRKRQAAFFLKTNPDRKIFHTTQVELNGFIHSILYRTSRESQGYRYFGPRAYTSFIRD